MDMVEQMCYLLFLIVNAVSDLKSRKISIRINLLFAIAGIALFWCGERDFLSLAGGILTGAYLMVFSALTKGGVGGGDGIAVMISGIFMGGGKNLLILMGGFCLLFCLGGVRMLQKKATPKTEWPFLPFFACSYVVLCLGGVV